MANSASDQAAPSNGAPGTAPLRIRLDGARQELSDATERGLGGRASLATYSDTVDSIVADLFTGALGGRRRRQCSRSATAGVISASTRMSTSRCCSPLPRRVRARPVSESFPAAVGSGTHCWAPVRELKDLPGSNRQSRVSPPALWTRASSPATAISSIGSDHVSPGQPSRVSARRAPDADRPAVCAVQRDVLSIGA